jgi:hypothetical protein
MQLHTLLGMEAMDMAFALIVVLYISDMHWYECGCEDMII